MEVACQIQCLSSLYGNEWKVNWTKQNGEVWFEKGWKEFVEHYSLDQGRLIFFKYEGTSQIDILILDQSALKIDYPCDTCDENDNLDHTHEAPDIIFGEWPYQKAGQMTEAYSLDLDHILVFKYVGRSEFQVVILDQSGLEMSYPLTEATLDGEDNGNSLPQSKRASSPLPFSPSTKKVKTNTRKETNAYPIQDEDVETKCAQSKRNKAKKRGGRRIMYANRRFSKSKAIQNEELLQNTESSTALERANYFHSENPFFIREMHTSYIKYHILSIPIEFARNHGMENITKVILRVGNRSWPVKLNYYSKHNYCRLTSGWSEFMSQCKLKSGDVCHFELIDKGKFVFEVRVTGCID
ncbi:B3 domain-containing transcription factor VRN1 [Glycine soja]|nr:B3 domain-containing transcription factor VRN1 [Glycine soja]